MLLLLLLLVTVGVHKIFRIYDYLIHKVRAITVTHLNIHSLFTADKVFVGMETTFGFIF
jgi:hypothetical protein